MAAMPELKERAKTLVELLDAASFIWADRPLALDDKAKALLTPDARALLGEVIPALEAVETWTAEATEQAVRGYAERKGAKLGAVAQPLRAALTGRTTSPGIFNVLAVLGTRGKPGAAQGSGSASLKAGRGTAPRLAVHNRMGYPIYRRLRGLRPRGSMELATVQARGRRRSRIRTWMRSPAPTRRPAKLSVGDKDYTFPIYGGTIGPDVIDVGKLYAQTGMFTYDPGFTSTGACESKITYIDGDEGILLYRGVPIEQLAEHGDFLETCYLLLYGELPTPAQKADFDYRVTRHTMVHEQMSRFFQGFRRDAHPMAVMTGSVGALSAFYHDSTDISDPTSG